MCGIAGTDYSNSQASELEHMLDRIRHRGPDDAGSWNDAHWRIGMRRLSIIDVASGHQPMHSADGRWTIVFNGEIYNFPELRSELTGRGCVFRTHSDTEVLLELIARSSVPEALARIEGMFAVAVVDTRSGDLWLARDRFGEKPLFIDRRAPGFAFCSELAPLLACRDRGRKLNPATSAALLRFGFPWPGTTPVDGIGELLPSQWLRRSPDGREETGCYWRLPDRVDEESGPIERCGERLLELLDASVKSRLVADVPLGLFLSGGIDSGAIAASAAISRPDIHAVTVGFDSAGYDERPLARSTAAHVGIALDEEKGATRPYSVAAFDELIDHYGQPFTDTSAVPTRAVSRAARKHFTVVLSGDGGDELLGGYIQYQRNLLLAKYGGGRPGAALAGIARHFVPESGRWEGIWRALTLNASRPSGLMLAAMEGVFSRDMLGKLLEGTSWAVAAGRQLDVCEEESRQQWHAVKDKTLAISLHCLRTSLPQDMLMKVDRMSMAESLETRAPFLDSKLAAYALSLPSEHKVRAGIGKYVMREALKSRLPAEVLSAPKKGFNLPVREWLGQQFWKDLQLEVKEYAAGGDAELNVTALTQRVRQDADYCLTTNSYRALHRGILLFSFLRWRRRYVVGQPLVEHQAEPVRAC